ncbi:hypothetical protein FRB91_011568 [Serendipita sp. 411]|nr:hypothetical protein FRC19_003503 [Serendipita sp. 401]KAG8847645.1 hypothetical protein FRB91_011568 [Serendipita sp. 411]KAG9055206.1 hypothetical protein FS842_002834 [Serendipita sp. 407]
MNWLSPFVASIKLSPAIQSLVQDPSHVARLRARPLSVFLALLLPVPLARPLHLQALVPLVQALVPLVRALALQVRAAHLALEALLFMDNAVDKGGQDLLPVHRVHAHTPVNTTANASHEGHDRAKRYHLVSSIVICSLNFMNIDIIAFNEWALWQPGP